MYSCVRSTLFILILSSILSSLALAQSENNPPPLRRVTLYKHGVGYFERQGKVNGDQQVTFLFDAAQVAATSREISEKQGEINTITKDQERMRENLRALGKTDEEKQLVQRYVAKIAQGEDQLERLRQEEKKLQDQRNNLQRQLDERVKKLAMDHRLN